MEGTLSASDATVVEAVPDGELRVRRDVRRGRGSAFHGRLFDVRRVGRGRHRRRRLRRGSRVADVHRRRPARRSGFRSTSTPTTRSSRTRRCRWPSAAATGTNDVTVTDPIGMGIIVNDDYAPVASPGSAYAVNEGDGLTLDASGTTDADSASLTYAWDVDGDGDFDENVSGVSPTLSPAQSAAPRPERRPPLGYRDGAGPRRHELQLGVDHARRQQRQPGVRRRPGRDAPPAGRRAVQPQRHPDHRPRRSGGLRRHRQLRRRLRRPGVDRRSGHPAVQPEPRLHDPGHTQRYRDRQRRRRRQPHRHVPGCRATQPGAGGQRRRRHD